MSGVSAADPLETPLQYLKGVGPRRAADLQRVGLATVEDLLYRFPIRYEDRGTSRRSRRCSPGVAASVVGEVVSCGIRPTRRPRFKIFEMLVRDRPASLRAVWFNQPFLNDVFHPHQRVILFGKLELTSHGLQMQSPQYEILRQDADGRRRGAGRGRRRDAPHRPHRPGLREDRAADHEDAARAGAPGAARSCRADVAGSAAGRRSARASS